MKKWVNGALVEMTQPELDQLRQRLARQQELPLTPEERLAKLEKALQALLEKLHLLA